MRVRKRRRATAAGSRDHRLRAVDVGVAVGTPGLAIAHSLVTRFHREFPRPRGRGVARSQVGTQVSILDFVIGATGEVCEYIEHVVAVRIPPLYPLKTRFHESPADIARLENINGFSGDARQQPIEARNVALQERVMSASSSVGRARRPSSVWR